MIRNSILQEKNPPNKLAGKRDFESGYDYFGGRIYNNKIALWNSTDPMSSMRPGLSPFNYCQNNPVNRIDPTGMLDNDDEWDEDDLFYSLMDGADGFEGVKDGDRNESEGDEGDKKNNNHDDDAETILGTFGVFSYGVDGALLWAYKYASSADELADLMSISRVTNWIGSATGLITAGTSVIDAFENPSPGTILSASVNIGMLAIKNPFVLGAKGLLDVTGVSDGFSREFDSTLNLMKSRFEESLLQFHLNIRGEVYGR